MSQVILAQRALDDLLFITKQYINVQQTRFDRRAGLQATLQNYLKPYNHHIPQRAIGSKTPIPALKEWQQKRP